MRQKLVEPLKEKQRQEGRAEAHIEWWEWNERRLEAAAKGEPFNEPVPYVPNGTTQDRNGSK